MAGFYGGGFGAPGAFTYTQIELGEQAGVLGGQVYEPNDRAGSLPIAGLRRDGPRLRFTADGLAFDLRRTATGFAGSVTTASGRRPAWFALRPGLRAAGAARDRRGKLRSRRRPHPQPVAQQ